MKKAKIILSIVLVVSLLFTFTACNGETALSAYDIAVENGFEGTQAEWLESLKGDSGSNGLSAYEIAVNAGYTGTEEEWLESLSAEADSEGLSAYEVAVKNGFVGTEAEWLVSLKGTDGENAVSDITIQDLYEAAKTDGYNGTIFDFINLYLDNSTVSTANAASKALLSSVSVYCSFTVRSSGFGGYSTTGTESQAGSGIIYKLNSETGDAYIITNYHVVYNYDSTATNKIAEEISIFLYGKEYAGDTLSYEINATYIGGSMTYDIAVLKVTACQYLINSDYCAVTVCNSEDVVVGETAIAVGNPEADGISVTSGIVSVKSEQLEMTGADDRTLITFRTMRIDTAVNSGNSGGGLFNSKGELIGIVNAKTVSEDVENIGYAIPSNIAIGAAQNIIDNCENKNNEQLLKYLLGIVVYVDGSGAVYNDETGVTDIVQEIVVQEISDGALATGYLQVGDKLLSIVLDDGTVVEINSLHATADALFWVRQGDSVTFNIIREVSGVDTAMQVVMEFTAAPPAVT